MPNPRTAAEWAKQFTESDGFALWVRGEADTGYLMRLLAREFDAYACQQVEALRARTIEQVEAYLGSCTRRYPETP